MQSYTQKLLRLLPRRKKKKKALCVKKQHRKIHNLEGLFFLWLGSEELFVCLLVSWCRAYPEGTALQTAAEVQAEAGGCYSAAALRTASIIQRMTNFIHSKIKREKTMSMLSTVGSEQRAVCRCCIFWLNIKILCPVFASPVPPQGRHHPLPTKPVSSRGSHWQPGERHRPTTASRFNLNNRRRSWKANLEGYKQKSLPTHFFFFFHPHSQLL